jgi:hypothetical protein
MTYFHTGTRTIIGAKAFHCPVRDGKEWDHLAMVVRHNWLTGLCGWHGLVEFIELRISWFLIAANVMGATRLRAMRA